MQTAEFSRGRLRAQFATRKSLNNANRRQTNEVKNKLQYLRSELEKLANNTKENGTREHALRLVEQVVKRLDAIERDEEANQVLEGEIIDADERRAARQEKAARDGR